MAGNLPDGCMFSSDADYYDAMRGPFDEADIDPTPESYGCERCGPCEACDSPCVNLHGDSDRALFCCRCTTKDAPASYRKNFCEICEGRV